MNDQDALYTEFQRHRPSAARLALLTCLPVRVSPQFVRQVRLCLLDGSSTGDEADLWLSDLVETRSAAGFSYRRGVRDWLRQRLAADRDLLDDLWQRVHEQQAKWLTPRARIEEELAWRLLRHQADPAIDAIWRSVITEMDEGSNAEGLARWVVRVWSDLPEGRMDHAAGRLAYYGARLLLGDASVLGADAQRFLESGELNFAIRRLPMRRIFVGLLRDGGLLIDPAEPFKHGHAIDLPSTSPLWLQLEAADGGATPSPFVITLDGTQSIDRALDMDALTLRLINGAAYRLSPPAAKHIPTRHKEQRLRIAYPIEANGNRETVELPFVVGVLSDLAGKPSKPGPDMEDRKFIDINAGNFDQVMAAIGPRIAFRTRHAMSGRESVAVELTLRSMQDFSPAAIMQNIDWLRTARETREQVARMLTYLSKYSEMAGLLDKFMENRPLLNALARRKKVTGDTSSLHELFLRYTTTSFGIRFADALTRITNAEQIEFERSLTAWARMTSPEIKSKKNGARKQVLSLIATCDRRLSSNLHSVLHHPDFQRLEAAWRGLHYLVSQTETDASLHIRVMQMSKDELYDACIPPEDGYWQESVLFKKVHKETFGRLGGQPFGCLVGDYYFNHDQYDVALMAALAQIAAEAHAPFIGGADARLLGAQSWRTFGGQVSEATFESKEYAAWNNFRVSQNASYLYLAAPRFLVRKPHGGGNEQGNGSGNGTAVWRDDSENDRFPEFSFEEGVADADGEQFTWANSAYVIAAVITRTFAQYGWCAAIRSVEFAGIVGSLPIHRVQSGHSGEESTGPLEISFNVRLERQLAQFGLITFIKPSERKSAKSFTLPSVYKPPHKGSLAIGEDIENTRLHYVLTASRFMHYIKCIMRENVGAFKTPLDATWHLQEWISQYVDDNLADIFSPKRAQHPLGEARVRIVETENPNYWNAFLELLPIYQLGDLHSNIRLSTTVPGVQRVR